MGIAEAASEPSGTVDAGQATTGKMGIDDAISAALGASETRGLSEALKETAPKPEPSKVKTRPEAKASAKSKPEEERQESAGEELTEEHAEGVDEAGDKDADEDKAETPSFDAPKHWPEDDRKAFSGLPKEGQEIVLKLAKNLQGGFTRKSQELSDKAKFADDIRSRFTDADRAQMARAGYDEGRTVDYLLSLQRFASKEPVAYVKWAMQNLGVSPQMLSPQAAAAAHEPPGQNQQPPAQDNLAELLVDPAVKQLEARLAQLQGIVEGNERQKQEAERARYYNSVNAINRELTTFRQALDDAGNLKYPHFDTVKGHMGALMDADPELVSMPDGQDKLQKAYEMAVYARPDLRQSFIEAEAQRRIQEAQKKQEAARAKKVTAVKPAAGVVSTRPKAVTLDDAISSSMSKFGL
jgi:hypothetical protein